jgi:asparagine synthase (glutamine-hydrolysing)
MSTHSDAIVLGSPQFEQERAAERARHGGSLAGWREALMGGAVQAAQQVKGDFAVALRESSGRIFMAVDRFAVQTLCYRQVGDSLRFAARADELAAPDPQIDAQALYDYLYFHVIPSPRTIFKDVFRLPAGHYALFEDGKLTVAPYWIPEFDASRPASLASLCDEFRGLIRQAVARQLDGSKPACFLSGGTDSSTVAGMIGEVCGRPAATYSIGFQASGYDEMAYARIAARHFKTEHHEYYVTPSDLVSSIAQVASHYDQPFGNSSALPAYYCELMAKSDGVTRLLAGDGGDELFGGNSRYAKQRVFDWYGVLPEALRTRVMEPLFAQPLLSKALVLRKGASYIEQARVPMPDRLHMYNLLMRLTPQAVLTESFLRQIDLDGPARQQRVIWAQGRARHQITRC